MAEFMIQPEILLAKGASYKTVLKDEVIFNEGSHCCFYYQIQEGQVKWVNIDEEGKEFVQNILEEGESFGELPLFDHLPYAASAIANTPCRLLRLSKSSFLQLLKEDPELHFKFSGMFTERLRFKFLLLKEIATHSPEQCISTLMNYFKNKQKHTCKFCSKVTLTRQQIADMTGLRVETVIRTLRSMHDQGRVTIERGKVYF